MYFSKFNKFIYDFDINTTYTVVATNLVIGNKYTIKTIGTTDFRTVGARVNKVGSVFTATGQAIGSGTVDYTVKRTDYVAMRDITQNVRVRTEILANVTLYDEYDIKEGETPEIIAEKVYGNPLYHWVVMLCNERFNYIDDFPLTQYELDKHITSKYGAGNEYDVHHYVDNNGYVVSSDNPAASSVSNSDYEYQLNEEKRRIKLITPQLLDTILKNFKDIM